MIPGVSYDNYYIEKVKRFLRQHHSLREKKITIITFLGLLFGLSAALLTFVMSTYFQQAISSDNVGGFYFVASGVTLLILINLHKVFGAFGRGRTLIALLLLQIILLFVLTMVDIAPLGAILLTGYYLVYSIIYVLWDIILEAYSTDKTTGHTRGLFLSVTSLGWLMGPLLSAYILTQYGFHALLFVVLVLYIVMFLVTLLTLNDIIGHNKKDYSTVTQTLARLYKRKSLLYIYIVAIAVRFFYAMMTIFVPLYMRALGMTWEQMGIIFTLMLLPLAVLEYPAGVLADKKWGEKELLFTGMVILIISSASVAFISSTSFALWAGVLIISRVGAALVEAMRDAYFYKHIDGQDTALINVFRTARPIAYMSAALIALPLLVYFDVRAVFVILAVVLSVVLYPIIRLTDTTP